MTRTITSADEIWAIRDTASEFIYDAGGGLTYYVFDYRPLEFGFPISSLPNDHHIIFLGGSGTDAVKGNDIFNRMYGYDGNDILYGGASLDIIFGGSGNDVLRGFGGNDKLVGGTGNDFIFGEEGDDMMLGGHGDDYLYGFEGNDKAYGGYGDDLLFGNEGEDTLYGFDGDDRLFGGDDDDNLNGGRGDDLINGHGGTNILTGGLGADNFYIDMSGGLQIVTDFQAEDIYLIDSESNPLGELNGIRIETGAYDIHATATNDPDQIDTLIFKTMGTETYTDDIIVMVLEDFVAQPDSSIAEI